MTFTLHITGSSTYVNGAHVPIRTFTFTFQGFFVVRFLPAASSSRLSTTFTT
jgi:hypothetical protein